MYVVHVYMHKYILYIIRDHNTHLLMHVMNISITSMYTHMPTWPVDGKVYLDQRVTDELLA